MSFCMLCTNQGKRKRLKFKDHAQVLGDRSTSSNFASSVPSSSPISLIYSQLAFGGMVINMFSAFIPGVASPNFVPRSTIRLNSTARPRRSSCHRRSAAVTVVDDRLFKMGKKDGRKAFPSLCVSSKRDSQEDKRASIASGRSGSLTSRRLHIASESISSNLTPPTPRYSFLWGM